MPVYSSAQIAQRIDPMAHVIAFDEATVKSVVSANPGPACAAKP